MSTLRRLVPALAVLSAAGLALTGCESTSGGGSQAGGADTFTVCTNSPYPPFEFEKDGKIVGFDMSLGDEIAKDLGREKNVVQANFETLESGAALDTDQCDAAISGITITDARKQSVDFSKPYFNDQIALLTPKDSGIRGFDSVGDKTVGVQQATSGEQFAKDKHLKTQQFEDVELMFQSLESGGVQAVSGNISTLSKRAKDNPDLEVVQTVDTNENLGVAVKKGNTEILDSVNKTLDRITSDGTMDKMKKEWMGL
ncbi:ABC transporter substrate-binding protein [Kocuria marina]|uniref:ABC transporter substrate-binding protein n=1 Tax=Kocuria marina TaxID=223184 RepID=UPI0019D1B9EC|nr:ABC transporter substrate-binding protein [Kocuria indica]MBN6810707.1 amino acid ABC transporter substrate-binding protein [Kocuria indica]MBN6842665.1 amino acid ABC transporter substrate-binding protein [Kocuria indica]